MGTLGQDLAVGKEHSVHRCLASHSDNGIISSIFQGQCRAIPRSIFMSLLYHYAPMPACRACWWLLFPP